MRLDMLARVVAGEFGFSGDALRKLRSDSVKNVKRTGGRVSLENVVRESDEAEWRG